MSGGVDGRLTTTQIGGLETWLEHVDPDDPVIMPQLMIDAVQALVEEVREWRAGALGADDVETLRELRPIVAVHRGRGALGAAQIALVERLLRAHGAWP